MIDWISFLIVAGSALLAASVIVTLFSFGLRFSDGEAPWRRPVSVILFVLCAVAVLYGIYLIVPALHR